MKIGIDGRASIFVKVGFGTYVRNLIKYLHKIDNENKYVIYNKPWGNLEDHILGDLWEELLLPLNLKKESIDIYHGTIGRLPLLKFNTKYIVTLHDTIPITFGEVVSKKHRFYITKKWKSTLKSADKIIAPSYCAKQDIIKTFNIPDDKIKVIYEGVEEMFRKLDSNLSFNEVRKFYGITKKYILAVGAIEPRKNIPALFSAYKIIKEKGFDYQLVVVGPGAWKEKLILNKINSNNNVIVTGYVPKSHLVLLYNAADVFVFPSLYEGFGLPLLEAMACGVPIAASNTSSLPEIGGDTALYFDPLNVDEMANTIKNILKNSELQQEMRNKGLERAKLFSWEKASRETLVLYKDLYGANKNKCE
jgi:glycosyltransferase involved in cell wall biosynthesis